MHISVHINTHIYIYIIRKDLEPVDAAMASGVMLGISVGVGTILTVSACSFDMTCTVGNSMITCRSPSKGDCGIGQNSIGSSEISPASTRASAGRGLGEEMRGNRLVR